MTTLTDAEQQAYIYLNSQYGSPFTGGDLAEEFGDFQQLISDVLFKNELGGNASLAYRFSHALSQFSSFSFGVAQWDIGAFDRANPPGMQSQLQFEDSETGIEISEFVDSERQSTQSLTGDKVRVVNGNRPVGRDKVVWQQP